MSLYDEIAFKTSKIVTHRYSTSFSIAVSLLPHQMRQAIYSIYGFVRFADEIVDTFHDINQELVLNNFERDYHEAINNGISMNPVLHAFAITVKKYNIPQHLIDSFLKSMRTDLSKQVYFTNDELKEYIYGSADVVGLMCLIVFVNGNMASYQKLKQPAMKLGSAFQKVNFLRDIKNDKNILGRTYFPELLDNHFDMQTKKHIEQAIDRDFDEAMHGVRQLPGRSKFAVAIAFFYYKTLFEKIKQITPERLLTERVRINNLKKYLIMVRVGVMYKAKLI